MQRAIVTDPPNKAIKRDSTFRWTIDGIYYFSSKVTVGTLPGSDNKYVGREFLQGTTKDTGVTHPKNAQTCYTRVKYRKYQGGPWCTDNSQITEFKSIP
jgi:hypothetical protein